MLEAQEFLKISGPLYDVRSPGEFLQGTITGAVNLPLFSDAERAQVGTAYKQISSETAFLFGLEITGPKLADFARQGLQTKQEGCSRIFCFRGGMRSRSMAWLFHTSGIETRTLKGGYKAFRRFVLDIFAKSLDLRVLGGLTGSGKTDRLYELESRGEQMIDLEKLAHHKGSAFGFLGNVRQPSTESFENALAISLNQLDLSRPIWIEDESRMIGTCKIPDALYVQMQRAPIQFLNSPLEERLSRLVADYGTFPKEQLIFATKCLKKRLGDVRTNEIIYLIQEGDLLKAAFLLLQYYDKAYKRTFP